MGKGGKPRLEDQGRNHVWVLMQCGIDFAVGLGKLPIGKSLFCVFVVLRRAD